MKTLRPALVAAFALVLVGWLVSGCKEAVEPITPKGIHDRADTDEEESKLPEDTTAEDVAEAPIPKPPPEEPPPDFQEAVTNAQSSDEQKERSGVMDLARFLFEGSPAQRQVAEQILVGKLLDRTAETKRRQRAAMSLGARIQETYPLLLQVMDEEIENTELVVALLPILLRPGYPAVTQWTLGLLEHPSEELRKAVAPALLNAYLATEDFDGLVSLLGRYDTDLSARAAIGLTLIGRETVPDLIRVLETSPNPAQRHGTALVLAMVCAGTSPQQERFAELAMTKVYVSPDPGGALLSADRRAVKPLMEALLTDESAKVREMAAQGLGYLGDQRAARPLAQALGNDPAEAVRRRAAAALIIVPAEPAQAALEQAVRTDESEHVRRYAAEALGWIGGATVVPALVDAAGDEAAEVRRYAAIELGAIAEEEELSERLRSLALVALVRLFDDSDSDVRWAAVMAVGKLRDRTAAQHLIDALGDPVSMVSHAAERGLQKIGIAQRRAAEFEHEAE